MRADEGEELEIEWGGVIGDRNGEWASQSLVIRKKQDILLSAIPRKEGPLDIGNYSSTFRMFGC
jgi:hypothetical protein